MKRIIPWSSLDYVAQHGTPTHTHVMMTLLRLTSPVTYRIEATQDEIATAANLSKETIKRSLRWLSEHHIISSARVKGSRPLVYKVHNRPLHDPRSDVFQRRVMGDPVETSRDPFHLCPDQGFSESLALIVHSEGSVLGNRSNKGKGTTSPYLCPADVYDVHNDRSGTVPDVILGADPDAEPREDTPAKKPKARRPVPPTTEVLDHWNLTARRTGSTPVTGSHDLMIFRTQTKRLLKAGLSVAALRAMINEFFRLDRHREAQAPHLLFFSKDVQRRLLAAVNDTSAQVSDIVLGWVGRGFVRQEDLPWDEGFDQQFQNLVLRRALSLAYRYPEVVADIARTAQGDPDLAKALLSRANEALEAALTGMRDNLPQMCDALASQGVTLPAPLRGRGEVRPEASTLHEAVMVACAYV